MLHHTKKFQSLYHMSLRLFNKLVDMLRPLLVVDERQSRNSTRNNKLIFPKLIVELGLQYFGGTYIKVLGVFYGISSHLCC